MLAHQLAAAHRSAMKMSAEMNRRIEYLAHVRGEEQTANIQATRLASASARMMTASRGFLPFNGCEREASRSSRFNMCR